MDYSIKIGGEAGQGIQTIGDTLAKVFSKTGYHVFTHQDYESRIRGGHNFFQIRLSNKPISASRNKIDILVALDKESILLYKNELSEQGIAIYNSSALRQKYEGKKLLDVPFETLAVEHGKDRIMANTVATGAVLGMLGLKLDILFEIINDIFRKKGEDVIKGNINAVKAGYDFASKNCTDCSFSIKEPAEESLMLINGVEAIGLGAISSGCKFYSAYPMTPSTGILNFMSEKAEGYGIVVEQAEDEIAAINMTIGASFAGVRAMTGTSGGGFALMVEGLSLAGMTETPVVIALGQRPGPATGFPTRTEQAELMFVLHTAHGEFPRLVFAPGTPEQAFYLTNKAFDIAERFQIPAFILFDQYLADSAWTFRRFDLSKIKYNDYRLRGNDFKKLGSYKRHAFTDTGVSPLAVPGDARHVVVTDSDEHDEEGHIVEDAETRIKMVQKRLLKKIPLIRQEMSQPILYGADKPDIVIVGWGSTYGVMKEAVDALSPPRPPLIKGGQRGGIAMLHFSEIYPFPSSPKFLHILNKAKKAICIENNATGQFARLMREETGYEFKYKINKYDGRPFIIEDLIGEINAVIG